MTKEKWEWRLEAFWAFYMIFWNGEGVLEAGGYANFVSWKGLQDSQRPQGMGLV